MHVYTSTVMLSLKQLTSELVYSEALYEHVTHIHYTMYLLATIVPCCLVLLLFVSVSVSTRDCRNVGYISTCHHVCSWQAIKLG